MADEGKVLYYTTVPEEHPVHLSDPSCSIGGVIPIRDLRMGDDGRPLCDECVVMRSASELLES
jgi:hypothetical protein